MSFDIVKTINFPQAAFQYVPQEILGENVFEEFVTLGGILSDLKHLWHAKGPCLEVRNVASGRKVGSWTFGGILNDSNTKIVAVDELKRPYGRLPLLVVALECTISGGLVCVFDIFGSKVLRVVQVRDQITNLHVVDSGCENSVLPEPSPLRYFDGIVAVGTSGGNVYLLDICRQICENEMHNLDGTIRDELNPCPMIILNKEKTNNVKKYVERSTEKEEHLAIHLNVVLNPSTEHFTLKGEKGEDRVHVNRSETEVSSLFYSPQIASLLVGYNFGAFQLWDLRSLELVYTSPICEEHIPVMHFTVQEPADDPKAYCYIWVSYSHNLMFHSGLPFAVMYSFYYQNKNCINGYGTLYEDFQHCSIRFQIELGDIQTSAQKSRAKGGTCIGLQSVNKYPINKELNSLSLCLISWLMWNSHKEINTSILVFDLNQWYKEQMPGVPDWSHCSNYIIKHSLNDEILDIKLDQKSLSQFIGIQRLEEHFCPTSLSFDLWCITENSILKVHNKGLQQTFIDKIVEDQHLSLVKPEDYFEQIASLGLVPLFCEIHLNNSLDIDYQREILLDVALEQKLIGWLCKCTSKLANNAFNASGLTLYNILNWAFERAITLKNNCDKYCVSLFDYSGTRLDDNTIVLLNSSIGQIRNICNLYQYISSKLMHFISEKEALLEEQRSLENIVVYFEVLLWMVNIGLLPECQVKSRQTYEDDSMSAPYLVQDLTQYYNRKRAQLQMASHDTFVEKDCLLFIDNLINNSGGAEILRQQWQEDDGSGLYPPPSLQSVLRVYFLDGPDLVFKHSVVTYTLLDIAMTVDENNKVIKLLLKFPQIFDLTLSNIKIVQAFWHLDHDHYETALEYALDPCVLTEDLHQWHHSVMMRSLLLQDQSSLALLYLQIRKPSIQDEKDILTVLSLLISKNMLDEAFKFRQQHQNPNEQALLLHIFNECNKNELLHTLLYRRLDNGEENALLKYLQNTKNPRCDDLKVFYYLLRSRFLEAFDSYSATKRKKPENQGLIGQRDATTADSIVKMFKTLLPDVNKNLVELVRKERTNLWREVQKPTPLSVFVHNARDQVRYKSSVIFAVLARAKQTFDDTLNDTVMNGDVVTEETPFLRTPTVFREVSRVRTPLMRSKVIEQNEQGEEFVPSPCKKLKLSPRASKTSPVKLRNLSASTVQTKLSTPIIRRQRLSVDRIDTTAALPQSILKGSSVSRTILDDSIFDANTSANTSFQLECENSVRRSRLALTPRKPVSRTPLKSHVKFDDLRYSGSSNEQNSKNESALHKLIPETSRSQSINSTASTVEEIFYSPENSFEKSGDNDQETPIETIEEKTKKKSLSPVKEKLSFEDTVTEDGVVTENQRKKAKDVVKISVEDNDLSTDRLTFQSPRSRRSYKRSFGESPVPVRSSPRLAKKASEEDKEDSSSSEPIASKSESLMQPSPSVAVQRLRGRKSLSRAVLENNAFSKLRSSSVFEETNNLGNRSTVSSVNTTINDSESEVDMEQSYNDSLDDLLKKYKTSALGRDSLGSKNDSLLSETGKDMDIFKEGEVVSKTTEIQSVETHRESVRKTDTYELVSSKETRDEYHSKKVEVFEQDVLQDDRQEDPVDSSIFEETTQDCNVYINKNNDDRDEDDRTSIADVGEGSGQDENSEIRGQEEVNVYEDLSSGSEDVREVLQQFEKKDESDEKVYADISFSTSVSYYQSEKKQLQMPENLMDSGESNSNDDVPRLSQSEHVFDNDIDMEEIYDDIPDAEKAFVDTGDVIEISSSSDEDNNQKEIRQDIDESSESSSSSSSEDKPYSSKDGSDEGSALNAEFENNLNRTAVETEKVDENSRANEDDGEEQTTALIQDENVEDNSDEVSHDSYRKLEDTQNKILIVPDESSSNEGTSNNMEQQFEMDQKEIADAVKMLRGDGLTEEQQELEPDHEHMDSLILEDQSPEKGANDRVELKIVRFGDKNQDVVPNEKQKASESDLITRERVEPPEEKEIVRLSEENDNRNAVIDEEQKTTQNDSISKENMNEKDIVIKNKEVVVNQATVPEEHASAKGIGTPASESNEHIQIDTDQATPQDNEATTEIIVEEKATSTSPLKQSRSLQCTLGVQNTLREVAVSVFPRDLAEAVNPMSENKTKAVDVTEKSTSTSMDKPSKSLEGDHDTIIVEDSNSVSSMEESLKNDGKGTPLIMRSVRKTYSVRGRKNSETSETVDLDATPKLAVSLTRRTYSKKDSGVNSKISDTTESHMETISAETQELSGERQDDNGVEMKGEDAKDSQEEPVVPVDDDESREISEDVESKEEGSVIKEKPVRAQGTPPKEQDSGKSPSPSQKKDAPNETAEDGKSKEEESVIKEKPVSTPGTPPKEQKSEKTVSPSQENDTSKPKNEEVTKPTPSMRVTRRRSMLLSQQEGTPSSASEKSVSSNGGDMKSSKVDKDGPANPSEGSTSEPSTSRSTLSQTPSSRRVTSLSQLSDSLFDASFVTESSVVRTEVDIMETSLFDDKIKISVERDVLETDEEGEEKRSPQAKAGPSKIRSRRSSKHGSTSGPSSSEKRGSHAFPPAQAKKRTRSASVDHPSTRIRKKSERSKSVDLDDIKDADTDSRMDLRIMLTPIKEKPGPSTEKSSPEDEVPKKTTKTYSDVGAYSTSRRLTRRQASMLKTIGSVEKHMKRLFNVEEMDPVHLMDKQEFGGKPDPDESNVFEQSSPTNSSGTPSRHTRSASVLSDVSTPTKRMSKVKNDPVDSPVSGIKARLRRQSTGALSAASEQSDSPSPTKRSKKKDAESEVENDSQSVGSAKRGRSRTSSVSSTKSAASDKTDSSVRATRSRRLTSAKSELPEIREEKDSEEGESTNTSVIKKRGRKKKD